MPLQYERKFSDSYLILKVPIALKQNKHSGVFNFFGFIPAPPHFSFYFLHVLSLLVSHGQAVVLCSFLISATALSGTHQFGSRQSNTVTSFL